MTLSPNVVLTRVHSLMQVVMSVLVFFLCIDGGFFFVDGVYTAAKVGDKGSCPLFPRGGSVFPFTTVD